jgi:tetratricopeptide (TPR) repeat protein
MRTPLLLTLALSTVACQWTARDKPAPSEAGGPLDEARALYQQGQLDAALAKALEAPAQDPVGLCLQGLIWARKAEGAPVPTAPPEVVGGRPPEFKREELTAIDFLERARTARPDLAEAHLGLANLLAPHAVRRFELAEAGRKAAMRRGARQGAGEALASQEGPDFSVRRVAELYRQAATAGPADGRALDDLLRFGSRVRDVDSQEWALVELMALQGENPEPRARYADFLVSVRKDRHKAIDYYRQALILAPQDASIKGRLADLYISLGRESFDVQQWGAALTMFLEAQKYVVDKNSPQGLLVREHLDKLGSMRQETR